MAHYRKIDVRIWNDEKFHRLTTHGKLAFLYLVTHPNMTNLGAMRATAESLSDELEVLPEAFAEAFKEGLAEADPKAKCILVKNFVKYQSAESPNVIKSWAKQLDFIPECGLKVQAIQYVKDYVEGLGEAFKEAFAKAFPESLSTKHLTLSKKEEALIFAEPKQKLRGTTVPKDFSPNATCVSLAEELRIDCEAEVSKFIDYHAMKGTIGKDWQSGFRNWLRNSIKFGTAKPANKADGVLRSSAIC